MFTPDVMLSIIEKSDVTTCITYSITYALTLAITRHQKFSFQHFANVSRHSGTEQRTKFCLTIKLSYSLGSKGTASKLF